MAGQRSNFRKFLDFSNLRVHISKTINRSGMGPSPACSPFNSAQNEVFSCISVEYLGRIHGSSEGHEMLKRNDKYHSIADDVPIPKM